MLSIVYLTYQSDYIFEADDLFRKWVNLVDVEIGVESLVIVDNFDTQSKAKICRMGRFAVKVIPGDNSAREFSGYQKGLSMIQGHHGIVLLLNDTFLLPKHRPWDLLLPAVIKVCHKHRKAVHKNILGEINRAPIGATFDSAPATWISTYCMLFSCKQLNTVKHAIQSAMNLFNDEDTKFNSTFTEHINRQIAGLPTFNCPEARLRKFQATAAEISLSRNLISSGLQIHSIYAVFVSSRLFAKYIVMRIRRKIAFIKRD